MMTFGFLLILALCQASSSSKPQHLIVSGTTNQTRQDIYYDRGFDGVYQVVQNASEFYGGKDSVTVYMRKHDFETGKGDNNDDVHIIVPTDEKEAQSVKYWFLPEVAMKVLEKFGLAENKKRAWVMKRGKREDLRKRNYEETLKKHTVWMSRLTDPEDKFDPDSPPINGWTPFLRQGLNETELCKELSQGNEELHKRIRVSVVRSPINQSMLIYLYDKKGTDQVTQDFILCTGQKLERLFLSRHDADEDPWYCGGRNDCQTGNPVDNLANSREKMPNITDKVAIDELFCPFYVSTSIAIPICTALAMMALCFLLYAGYEFLQKEANEKTRRGPFVVTPVEEKVNAMIQAVNEGGDFPEGAYQAVHEIDGGVELLFGCTFDFPRHPQTWHRMAQLIHAEERKIHEDNHRKWKACIRKKAKSARATRFCRSLESPNCLRVGIYHVKRALNRLLDPVTSDDQARCHKIWVTLNQSLIPITKTTIYLLDFIKDGCLFLFLLNRLKFIYSHAILLKKLIVFHGLSILTSSCVVGWAIQVSGAIVNLDEIESTTHANLLRIFFFLVTPLIPVAIVYKAVSFSIEKQMLKAKWRKSNDVGVTSLWHSYNLVHKKNRDLMVAYSDLKMVEASLEAVPQIYFLTIFFLAAWLLPETTLLGLTSAPKVTFDEGLFLFLSVGHSYATTILSIISAMDIRQHGKMTFANKVLLALSVTFQIAGRLWPMVVTSMLAIVETPPLSASQAGLLLILPVVTHWVNLPFKEDKKCP